MKKIKEIPLTKAKGNNRYIRLEVLKPVLKRFFEKINVSDTNYHNGTFCWEWIACIESNGYGRFKLNGKNKGAHRLSYEEFKGKIPKGFELDHLCRNRKCVNPIHLEAVPHKENVLRGLAGKMNNHNSKKTHCPQNHEYTKENTYNMSNGARRCRTCIRIECFQRRHNKKVDKKRKK